MSGTRASDPIGKSADRRKLIAVVYADMVGYSRLIGLDDVGTLERLRRIRSNLIDPTVAEHGGRIVNTGGDSLLIVFDSVDGAVRCAVKIQQQVPVCDGDQPSDRAIRFRIGINIGDAIADGTDLHGDVVNVAARLQAECPPCGICVTRAVRDHIQDRLDLEFEEVGALKLKNIVRPVEAFTLRLEPKGTELTKDLSSKNPLARQMRPRLSVLVAPVHTERFPRNLEHLARGIAEDVATDLSRLPCSFVVSRTDAALQSGALTSTIAIARDLGVNYVIQGSMRKSGRQVLVNMQLISTESEAHLWERFQVNSGDIVDARDVITSRLVRIFTVKLIEDVHRRIEYTAPHCWTPDDLVMLGMGLAD